MYSLQLLVYATMTHYSINQKLKGQGPVFSATLNPKALNVFASFDHFEKQFEIIKIADVQAHNVPM